MTCNPIDTIISEVLDRLFDLEGNNLRSSLIDYLKTVKLYCSTVGYSDISKYVESWVDEIYEEMEDSLGDGMFDFSKDYIESLIMNPEKQQEQKQPPTTEELDYNHEGSPIIRKQTIDRLFKGVDQVTVHARKRFNTNINKAILYNIDKGTITRTPSDIIKNIHEYKQELFDTIFKFMGLVKPNDLLFLTEPPKIWVDGNFVGIPSNILNTINSYFSSVDLESVLRHFNARPGGDTSNEAFESWVLFNNFDLFFLDVFPQGEVTRASDKIDNTYVLNTTATNMRWSNAQDDDIDVTQSVNGVSKSMVLTVNMYDYRTGQKIPGITLSYGSWVNAIGNLHMLSWDLVATSSIILNPSTFTNLSQYTIEYLNKMLYEFANGSESDFTLRDLIDSLRGEDLLDAYTALFEILTDPSVKDNRIWKPILNRFTQVDLNVIQALRNEMFGLTTQSLRSLYETNGYNLDEVDFLDYILQTADSIWPVPNALYIANLETGNTALHSLQSNAVDRERFKIEDVINRQNNPQMSTLPSKYKVGFSNDSFDIHLNDNWTLHFDKLDGLTMTSTKNSEKPLNLNSTELEALFQNQNYIEGIKSVILPFIDDILKQDFGNSQEFWKTTYYELGSSITGATDVMKEGSALFKLTLYASAVLKNIHVALLINNDPKIKKTKSSIEEAAKIYYSDDRAPKCISKYRTINLIPKKLKSLTLDPLAKASAMSRGSALSTVVNDSQGKAIALSSPSRLMGTFHMLWLKIRLSLSPANSFNMIQDPSLLVDLQTIRDYKGPYGKSKLYKDFNTREFLESSILYDFLYPLTLSSEDESYSVTNSASKIAITPSVNSDKNTIAKMILDLSSTAEKLGFPNVETMIRSMSQNLVVNLINNSLGGYYKTIVDRVNEDYRAMKSAPIWSLIGAQDITLSYDEIPQIVTDGEGIQYEVTSFDLLALRISGYGITPRLFFDTVSKQTGIKVQEPLHVLFLKNDSISENKSLKTLYFRHNNKPLKGNFNTRQFLQYKNSEYLQSLVKNGVLLNITDNKNLYTYFHGNEENKQWVSSSGNLIFAKAIVGGYEYQIESILDFKKLEKIPEIKRKLNEVASRYGTTSEELINNPHILAPYIQMNPWLANHNALSYLFSLEYLLSTVGSHINHPSKKAIGGKIDYLNDIFAYMKEEADRYLAQHKRNVSQTAAMHEFRLGLTSGIPSSYNIACIADIKDEVWNVMGDHPDVKPFDGATFVNPWIVILENNSLGGEKAGIHKKLFVHFYDMRTGTGGIIKTAGFGITNDWMKKSPFMKRMMKNMTNSKWMSDLVLICEQLETYINLLAAEGKIVYREKTSITNPKTGEVKWEYRNIKINAVTLDKSSGKFMVSKSVVDNHGNVLTNLNPSETSTIDSNYKVWNELLGGELSMSLNVDGVYDADVQYGELSNRNMVFLMNNVGNGDRNAYSQKYFYQPMKHSDTHYAVTEGALKQGTANFNESNVYYENADNGTTYNKFRIDMDLAGILLDKEHHADNSEISMMTQVVSACAQLGYTWDEANKMYQALYNLTLQGLRQLHTPIVNLLGVLKGDPDYDEKLAKVDLALSTLIVKSLSNSTHSKDGVIYDICQELIDKYNNGGIISKEDLENNPLPISDSQLFSKLVTSIGSVLTKASIKMKFSGILSVLVPSHEVMKVYDTSDTTTPKMYNNFVNAEEELKAELSKMPILEQHLVQIGRQYYVLDENNNVVDRIMVLAPVSAGKVFGDPKLKYVGYYDLNTLYPGCKFQQAIYAEGEAIGRNLAAYTCEITTTEGEKFNFYDIDEIRQIYEAKREKKDSSYHLKRLQNVLTHLKEGGIITVNQNGITKKVKIAKLVEHPYEVIMPKSLASKFGLTSKDNIGNLYDSAERFIQKAEESLKVKVSDTLYTVALERMDKKHTYILSKQQGVELRPLGLKKLPKIEYLHDADNKIQARNGNNELMYNDDGTPMLEDSIWRVDENGNKLLLMYSDDDLILVTESGEEVILTDHPEFYIENYKYTALEVSPRIPNTLYYGLQPTLTTSNTDNVALKQYLKYGIDNRKRYIQKIGRLVHTSFRKAMNIVAARIPAQSMLSFMPMRVVGFEDFDINTAYVSTHLIWLQGSDYRLYTVIK